jgi:hypothetical protein
MYNPETLAKLNTQVTEQKKTKTAQHRNYTDEHFEQHKSRE